jgi:hypothetical protein
MPIVQQRALDSGIVHHATARAAGKMRGMWCAERRRSIPFRPPLWVRHRSRDQIDVSLNFLLRLGPGPRLAVGHVDRRAWCWRLALLEKNECCSGCVILFRSRSGCCRWSATWNTHGARSWEPCRPRARELGSFSCAALPIGHRTVAPTTRYVLFFSEGVHNPRSPFMVLLEYVPYPNDEAQKLVPQDKQDPMETRPSSEIAGPSSLWTKWMDGLIVWAKFHTVCDTPAW